MFTIFILLLAASAPVGDSTEDNITYDDHIKPVFQQRCSSCHNSNRKSGGIDLTNYTAMMQGGGSGNSVEPGDAEGSYLYMLVTHDESPEMPPNGKIPDAEIERIAAWINGGALENKGSVARKKKKSLVSDSASIGVRPDQIAYPMRMSLEPYLITNHEGIVNAVATSPWASLVALSGSKQVLLYDLVTESLLGAIPFPEGRANVLRFSRNGKLLIAGGGRHGLVGKVFGWDVQTGERLFEIGEELDNVLSADITADHALVAFGGPQRMLRVYSTESEQAVYEIKKHTDWVTAIAFSPDGVLLASADRAGGLHLWEAATGNEYLTLGGHSQPITDLSWRSDGNVLASVGDDGAVRVWEVENGRQIKSWNAHGRRAASVEFSRDGKLATTGSDKGVKLWQQDGKLIRQFKGLNDEGIAISYCDESKRIVATDLSGKVVVWNLDNEKPAASLASNPSSLSARLATAKNKVDEINGKLSPIREQAKSTTEKIRSLEVQVAEQSSLGDRITKELTQINVELSSTRSEIENAITALSLQGQELAALKSALPKIQSAKEQAVEAAKLLPNDESLKQIASTMTAKFEELSNLLTSLENQIKQSDEQKSEASNKVVAIQKRIVEKQSNLDSANERLKELASRQNPLNQKLAGLTSEVSKLEESLKAWKLRVATWEDEIAFHHSLKQKSDQLKSVQLDVAEKESTLQKVKTRLDEVQAEFENANATREQSVRKQQQIESELYELRRRKQ